MGAMGAMGAMFAVRCSRMFMARARARRTDVRPVSAAIISAVNPTRSTLSTSAPARSSPLTAPSCRHVRRRQPY
eukprot:7254039-Prymnesium_polylepis.1